MPLLSVSIILYRLKGTFDNFHAYKSRVLFHSLIYSLAGFVFPLMQITIDNCVEVEHIATELLLEDVKQNIGDCYQTYVRTRKWGSAAIHDVSLQ